MSVLSLTNSNNQVFAIRLDKLFRSIIKRNININCYLVEKTSAELIAEYFDKLFLFSITGMINLVDSLDCSLKLLMVLQIELTVD